MTRRFGQAQKRSSEDLELDFVLHLNDALRHRLHPQRDLEVAALHVRGTQARREDARQHCQEPSDVNARAADDGSTRHGTSCCHQKAAE